MKQALCTLLFSLVFEALLAHGSATAELRQPLIEKATSSPPVVLILFDELPTNTLLDSNDQIDAVRFPNFSRLASEAYWFRNTSTVNQFTAVAVPAVVSGLFPTTVKRQPVAISYPNTLFTLLGRTYDMNVYEPYTKLCPGRLCAKGRRTKRFLATQDLLDRQAARKSKGWSGISNASEDRISKFKRYIGSLKRPSRPTLYFMHSILPHMPFQFMPSLRRYKPDSVRGYPTNRWTTNTASIEAAYHQYLLQTGAADTLLGKLVQRLKEIGVYDRALVIVTADHGVSFRPGDYRRGDPANPNFIEDILYIPLFMKLPGQTTGVIDYSNIETIDILPTIADVLKIQMPWQVDGRSVFDSFAALRTEKQAFVSRSPGDRHPDSSWPESGGIVFSFPAPPIPPRNTLEWKLSLPAYTTPSSSDHFYVGPYDDYVGKPAKNLAIAASSSFAFKLRHDLDLAADRKSLVLGQHSGTCPCRLTGDIRPLNGAVFPSNQIAVGINGILWGFTQIDDVNGHPGMKRFDITISDSAFRTGSNSVQIYLTEGSSAEDLRLIKIQQSAS